LSSGHSDVFILHVSYSGIHVIYKTNMVKTDYCLPRMLTLPSWNECSWLSTMSPNW